MLLFGIFSSFYQSHSSLCSFKKTKIFSIKIHKSFAKQFIEVPLMEIMISLQWFNPYIYRMKKEL